MDVSTAPRPPDGDSRPPSQEALAWVDDRSKAADGSAETLYRAQVERRDRLLGDIEASQQRVWMLALYREAADLIGRDGLRCTYTTDSREAACLDADPDVEVLWRDGDVCWYESEEQRREFAELGIDAPVVTLWTAARWVSPYRPRRTQVPSSPYPFVPVVVRLGRDLEKYPDAETVVRPHLLALRTRDGALVVIERLAVAERKRQDELRADVAESEDRVRAAWWRYENPLPVSLPYRVEQSSSYSHDHPREGVTSTVDGLDTDRLRTDRSYIDEVVANWLHDSTERSLAAAYRRVRRAAEEAGLEPAYVSEGALRASLERRDITVQKMKTKGDKVFK